jgi:quercetin dioxygenase-like cupin family protein
MDVKSNESTDLRPEGDRIIDAPFVSMHLPEFIRQIKSEATWENSDRNALTIYKTNGMRMVLIALHEEAVIKKHTAEGIISVQLLEGEIVFSTDEQSVVMKEGEVIALHKGLPHEVKANKESVFLLTLTTTMAK